VTQIASHDVISNALSRPLPDGSRSLLAQFAPGPEHSETVYISTPITTGPRLLEWLAAHNRESGTNLDAESELVRQEVIDDNVARLAPLRANVSSKPGIHVIDPTVLEVPGWAQWEYHRFWAEVLTSYVDRVVFADGWHLSTGCTVEYAVALAHGIPASDSADNIIEPADAAKLLNEAAKELRVADRSDDVARAAAGRARDCADAPFKDTTLAALSEHFNVASFVSFTDGTPHLRHHVSPGAKLSRGSTVEQAIAHLFAATGAVSLNVRTFIPSSPKGNPFYYGLDSPELVAARVREAASDGFHTIVNETVDVHDGGVSGVSLGGLIEFAPDDTPRAVETADTAKLPLSMADHILRTVYGPQVTVPADQALRIEFSIHPGRVGHRREHVIVWETESVDTVRLEAPIQWPNRFSALLGDKTFGLLVADACGVAVPATTVVCRRVAPFRFGRDTGSREWWTRTAPNEQEPGHFTTVKGWIDPFALLEKEDGGRHVAAVLAQEGVDAIYSGATLPVNDGDGHVIEGVTGRGDDFMLGVQKFTTLPADVRARVRAVVDGLETHLGTVRIEWAADANHVWVLQLHRTDAEDVSGVISSGDATEWWPFNPERGLEELRELVGRAMDAGAGVEVTKVVGITSHVGDILRKARVPARFNLTRA
jgi:hypothetical protein